jgi:tRNA 2-selenouridine synthase
MNLQRMDAAQAIAELARFSAIVDARSEDEFAQDHLPGAVNWPTLNNHERHTVGTLYKQVHPFDASKHGAVLAARNIASHIERELGSTGKNWQPLIYCWRGGKRSGALALVLSQIGFRVTLIDGGYKAFRTAVLAQLPELAQRLNYRVICGPTGSGKTRALQTLRALGSQVLDLEELACHRASVLGSIPGTPQPSQRQFETQIWDALRRFDSNRVVFVESESRKVGDLSVPTALIERMRQSPCLDLQLPLSERVQLLLEDYPHHVNNPQLFCERLAALTELRGKSVVQGWQELARRGEFAELVQQLLTQHYDPGYAQSMQRNFSLYPQAQHWVARSRHASSFVELCSQLRQQCDPQP